MTKHPFIALRHDPAVGDGGGAGGFAGAALESEIEVNNVFGDTSAYIGVMDPLGVGLTLDAGLYEALLDQLANEIARCTDA